eukprot:366124-Chlamydomonas_euryale.AAC.6
MKASRFAWCDPGPINTQLKGGIYSATDLLAHGSCSAIDRSQWNQPWHHCLQQQSPRAGRCSATQARQSMSPRRCLPDSGPSLHARATRGGGTGFGNHAMTQGDGF